MKNREKEINKTRVERVPSLRHDDLSPHDERKHGGGSSNHAHN